MSVRKELDALHAALFHMQQQMGELRLEHGISKEETYKRLVWYSHLERLAIVVNDYLRGKATKQELADMHGQIASVHRFVSPAVRTPEQDAQAEAEWRRPA